VLNALELYADLTISNVSEATPGFEDNSFLDHRTMCLIKLVTSTMPSVTSTMLSAAMKTLHYHYVIVYQILTKFVERQ